MKQLSMYDLPNVCSRKSDYIPVEDVMERVNQVFEGNVIVENTKYVEPQPCLQVKPIFKIGFYFRTKADEVFEIDCYGNDRIVFDRYKFTKTKDGRTYKNEVTKKLRTFVSYQYFDGENVVRYHDETEILECHEKIIDCIYKGDFLFDYKNRKMEVISKISNKKETKLLCAYGGDKFFLCNEDIKYKCNREIIRIEKLDVGDKIFHKNFGWVEIVKKWHHKAEVINKKNEKPFFVYEVDILYVEDCDE